MLKTGQLSKDLVCRRAETSKLDLAMWEELQIGLESLTDTEPDFHSASDSEELDIIISYPSKNVTTSTSHDPEFFISYNPTTSNPLEDKAYSVHFGDGPRFPSAARDSR